MAASLGSLVVSLGLNAAEFVSGINKINRDTQKFSNDLQNSFNKVKGAVSALGIGLGGLSVGTVFTQMVQAAKEAEMASNRLTGAIRATGSAAGVTKSEIDGLADAMAKSTQFDDESIRNAASELLIFRNVQGDVFKETLALATDVAAAMGTTVPEAASRLGRSLEDPDTAFGLLRRQGVLLSEQQKDVIKSLQETGNTAEAQRIILDKLQGAYGGLAQEINKGINKSTNDVKKAWDELMESFGKTSAVQGVTQQFLRGVAGWLDDIKTVIDSGNWTEKLIGVMSGGFGLKGIAQDIKGRGETRDLTGEDARDAAIGASIGARQQQALQKADAAYVAEKKRQEELKKAREAAARAGASALESYQGKLRSLDSEIRTVLETETELQKVRDQMAGDKGFQSIPSRQREQLRTSLEAAATQIDQAREQKKIQEENKKLLEEGNKGWVAYADGVLAASEAEDTFNASLIESPKELKSLADSILQTVDPTRRLKEEMILIDDLVKQGFITEADKRFYLMDSRIRALLKPTQNLSDAIQQAWEAGTISTEEMQKAVNGVLDTMDQGESGAKDFAHAIGTSFEDAILKGEEFSDVLKGLLDDITRIALRMTVTKPLESQLENVLGKGLPALFSFGGGGGAAAPAVNYGGNVGASTLGGYATGTDYVPRTGPYLLHQGEAVIPAGQNGGSSIDARTYVDARGATQEAIPGIVAALNAHEKALARLATNDQYKRGGQARALFR